MEPVTALVIVSLGLGLFASVTSCFTCYRTERYMARSERETTSVEIDNSVIDRKEPDGSTVHTRKQHIKIDDIEASTFTGHSTTIESGRPNDVASVLAGAASGGLSALAGRAPGSLAPALPAPSIARLPRLEEEKSVPPTIIIDEDSDQDKPAQSLEKSGHHARRPSGAALLVSVVSDALADDGIVDAHELGEIMVSVLGDDDPVLSDADSAASSV